MTVKRFQSVLLITVLLSTFYTYGFGFARSLDKETAELFRQIPDQTMTSERAVDKVAARLKEKGLTAPAERLKQADSMSKQIHKGGLPLKTGIPQLAAFYLESVDLVGQLVETKKSLIASVVNLLPAMDAVPQAKVKKQLGEVLANQQKVHPDQYEFFRFGYFTHDELSEDSLKHSKAQLMRAIELKPNCDECRVRLGYLDLRLGDDRCVAPRIPSSYRLFLARVDPGSNKITEKGYSRSFASAVRGLTRSVENEVALHLKPEAIGDFQKRWSSNVEERVALFNGTKLEMLFDYTGLATHAAWKMEPALYQRFCGK